MCERVQGACAWTYAVIWKTAAVDGGPVMWETLHACAGHRVDGTVSYKLLVQQGCGEGRAWPPAVPDSELESAAALHLFT